jgi:hypothetical protein
VKRLPLLLALVLALTARLPAAEESPVKVQVTPDRSMATVGDRILLRIAVTHPADVTVLPPAPVAGNGSALLLEAASSPEPSGAGKGAQAPRSPVVEISYFQAQAFETGKAEIPAFRVDWRGPGGKSGSVSSEPLPIEIASVLKGPQENPADLKPPAELPPPPFPWKLAGLAALAAALIAAAAVLWKRRRRRAPEEVAAPAGPVVPPHEAAYRDLERLLASGLLREGKIKEFHIELAEIIKRYLAGRFEIETLERTSEEVLEEMKRVRVGTGATGLARDFLSETDLVKFAKYLPREDEVRGSVDRAYRIVDQTKLVAAAPVPAASGTPPPALSQEAAP